MLPAPEAPRAAGLEREQTVQARVNQWMFRQMVLVGFGESCAVCGLPYEELLVASHIVPWAVDASARMSPRNGLCLCGTHDRAFERGILRVMEDYSIRVILPAPNERCPAVRAWLTVHEGKTIRLPHRWRPDPIFLARKLEIVSTAR
jgi:predicted restriction endonuclease